MNRIGIVKLLVRKKSNRSGITYHFFLSLLLLMKDHALSTEPPVVRIDFINNNMGCLWVIFIFTYGIDLFCCS